MKIIVIGGTGMLGTDCVAQLRLAGHDTIALGSADIDITQRDSVNRTLDKLLPMDIVVNCAAYTAVDLCESNQETAFLVNGIGPKHIAKWCTDNEIPMIHFSTDYVFEGTTSSPYSESDTLNPKSVYGQSKLQGEMAVLRTHSKSIVMRVQWLYGHHGPHFIRTILRLAETQTELKVVNDQWGSPTWTWDLAGAVAWMVRHHPAYGIYHWHNSGYTTWYDLARKLVAGKQPEVVVKACTTSEFPRPASRPLNGRLAMDKFLALPDAPPPSSWENALSRYLRAASE